MNLFAWDFNSEMFLFDGFFFLIYFLIIFIYLILLLDVFAGCKYWIGSRKFFNSILFSSNSIYLPGISFFD